MILCSFFTNDLYGRFGERLKASCDSLGLRCEIRPREDRKEWGANCQEKPKFIREMMEEFPRHNIAWVDCDAEVKQAPWLFFAPEFDIATRLEGEIVYAGTLFFRQCPVVRDFLEQWIRENKESIGQDDRPGFLRTLKKTKAIFKVLPTEYCFIPRFDNGNPVIEHYVVSRLVEKDRDALLS